MNYKSKIPSKKSLGICPNCKSIPVLKYDCTRYCPYCGYDGKKWIEPVTKQL